MCANIYDFNTALPEIERPKLEIGGIEDFFSALHKAGYEPDTCIKDKFCRFHIEGDKQGHKNGWYIYLEQEYPVAFYGDWKSGERYEWKGYNSDALNERERSFANAQWEAKKAWYEARIREKNEQCALESMRIWENATQATGHKYLADKKVESYGLKRTADILLIPMQGPDGKMRGLQKIMENGARFYHDGTNKKGGFFQIGAAINAPVIGLCEGYATGASIHKACGLPIIMAFDAGNLIHVARYLKQAAPDSKIINFGDDDCWKEKNTGRIMAGELAAKLDIKTLFPTFHHPDGKSTDWNDLAIIEGLDEVKRQISAGLKEQCGRLQILSNADILGLAATQWRVQDLLPAQGIAAIFGAPGAGKSFLALDLALAIAEGVEWFGLETYSAPVLYINQESGWGLQKRLRAWMDFRKKQLPSNISYLLDPVRIVEDSGALAGIIPKCAVTVIDTLNSVAAGLDENNPKDMGLIIEAAHAIRRETGGLVIFIHHSGKDSDRGARGHSSLHGALDAEIQLIRKGYDRIWKTTKIKEGDDNISRSFTLIKIPLGLDDHCRPISSCAVEEVSDAITNEANKRPKLKANAELGLSTLREVIESIGTGSAPLEEWRKRFYAKSTADQPGTKRKYFNRARIELVEAGAIDVNDNIYCIMQGW